MQILESPDKQGPTGQGENAWRSTVSTSHAALLTTHRIAEAGGTRRAGRGPGRGRGALWGDRLSAAPSNSQGHPQRGGSKKAPQGGGAGLQGLQSPAPLPWGPGVSPRPLKATPLLLQPASCNPSPSVPWPPQLPSSFTPFSSLMRQPSASSFLVYTCFLTSDPTYPSKPPKGLSPA